MSEATHVLCPRCNAFEPMIWKWTAIETIGVPCNRFEGGIVVCRTCQFEVTKIGTLQRIDRLAGTFTTTNPRTTP